MSRRQQSRPRIGLISPYHGGNLGDAAIIESARKQLLGQFGDPEFILLVLNPERVRKLHGLDTFQLSALPLKFYHFGKLLRGDYAGVGPTSSRNQAHSLRHRIRAGLKRVGGNIPFALPVAKGIRDGVQKFFVEAHHVLDARRIVRSLDGLLIAGGGQFVDEFGGPWGHPYSVYKWAKLAHSQHVPVYVVGVGIGVKGFRYHLSRWFFRKTLTIAQRVSVRDAWSIEALRKMGIRRELVPCPDLAFSLTHLTDDEEFVVTRSAPHTTIGLSPIAFGLPGSWPTSRQESFDRYWREFQALAHSLIKDNHFVRLFATDEPDYPLAQMLYNQIAAASTGRDRIQLLPPLKLPDLMAALPNFDAVVASRLHGVLLSHISRTPVLAISYLPKVSAQMEDMGHERFCLNFETFVAPEAQRRLNELLAERGRLASDLGRACRDRHKAVTNEFAAICADLAINSR